MIANAPWRLLEGSVIQEQYHLERLLGAGGYGGVYRASEVVCDRVIRQLAIKMIVADDSDIDRQLQELQFALRVEHSNLLRCFGCGETIVNTTKFLYLLMELADYSLQQRLDRTALNEDETRVLLQDIATGLIYLHDHNKAIGSLVHRDLNPGNIFWVGNRWKIGDFGITRQVGNNIPGESINLVGRPGFAPPESYRGEYTPATDMWSLGVIAVYALHRTLPFNAQTTGELRDRVVNCHLAVPTLSNPFREIVQNCLRREPGNRWTADRVYNALQPPPPPPPPLPPPPPPQVIERERVVERVVQRQVPVYRFSRRWVLSSLVFGGFAGALGWEYLRPKSSLSPLQSSNTKPLKPDGATVATTNVNKTTSGNYTENLKSGVTLEMVAIPEGTFLMGLPDGEGNDYERPQHQVKVPGFYMGKYVVTNAQWKAVMGTDPVSRYDAKFAGSNQPVIGVSWNDAQEFCQKLSGLSGRKYRLPTEAEWEYACRAGTTTPFYFGENINTEQVNYDGNYPYKNTAKGEYRGKTTEVGRFPANRFGLYDMHGNVWEWCEDEWHNNYNGAPTDGSAWVNKNENRSQSVRLLRGGSWYTIADYCRSAYRGRYDADDRYYKFGFRVVCS